MASSKKSLRKLLSGARERLSRLREKVRFLKAEEERLEHFEENQVKSSPKEMVIKFSLLSTAKATVVVLLLLWGAQFLGKISDILILFFVSLLFSAALSPTIDSLERKKIPRSLSILLLFAVLLLVLGLFISKLIPLVASQVVELARNLADFLQNLVQSEKIQGFLQTLFGESAKDIDIQAYLKDFERYLTDFGSTLKSFAGDTLGFIKEVFNGVLNFILFLILTYFFVVDAKKVDHFILSIVPSKHGRYVAEKGVLIKQKVGYWLQGQILVMLLVFAISYIIFLILGLNYALTLAILLGLVEIIPVVGFFVGIIFVLLVAFNQSMWIFVWVLITQLLLQQAQTSVITPLIMRKTVGLHPIVVIFALLVGYSTLQFLGVLISIPVATSLSILFQDFTSRKKLQT